VVALSPAGSEQSEHGDHLFAMMPSHYLVLQAWPLAYPKSRRVCLQLLTEVSPLQMKTLGWPCVDSVLQC